MESGLTEVAHVIQVSVAPVFLRTGVEGLLAILTSRLGRIIDRSRVLEVSTTASEVHKQSKSAQEHAVLGRRSQSIHLAIGSVTPCAFLVCAVISALFLGVFFALDVSNGIGLIFPAATLALIGGLVAFLREIQLATSSLSGPKGG